MFGHEAVDRNHTIVSLYSVAKNICESRDNLGLLEYGSTCLNASSDRYTDLAKVAKAWQMMFFGV
jgi:hypothetical protein